MAAHDRRTLIMNLVDIEARLAAGDASTDCLCERADHLAALDRKDEARQQYLEALQRDPGHFATLINFGTLLYETDFRTAARTVFTQAAALHPAQPVAHLNLGDTLMQADELDAARASYETALRLDPGSLNVHQRLSALFREIGDMEAMRRHHRLGFAGAPLRRLPCLGEGEAVDLLLLTSTPGGDVAWRKLVDRQVFAVTELTAEFHDPATPLPPHDLVFNAIGDADLSRDALEVAGALVALTHAPVVNPPVRVLESGRMDNARRLAGLPGVRAPRIARLPRAALAGGEASGALAGHGFYEYPLLLRSPGFHTGRHFVRVDAPDGLAAAAAALPGEELMVIEHLDARGADGCARKYRVMTIGGRLYPLHLAVSRDWKVHYFTGAMSGDEAFQAEEARFLEDMPSALGPQAMTALDEIQGALGLDYGGVDFGLDGQGRLLLFEANAVMNIVRPDASPQWDYRRPAIARASEAARAMLVARAGRACGSVAVEARA